MGPPPERNNKEEERTRGGDWLSLLPQGNFEWLMKALFSKEQSPHEGIVQACHVAIRSYLVGDPDTGGPTDFHRLCLLWATCTGCEP